MSLFWRKYSRATIFFATKLFSNKLQNFSDNTYFIIDLKSAKWRSVNLQNPDIKKLLECTSTHFHWGSLRIQFIFD